MTRWRSLLASILGGFVSLVRGGLDQVLAGTMISPRLFHPRFSIRFFLFYLVASLFTDVVFSLLGFSPFFLLTPAPRLPLLLSAISISIFVDFYSGGRPSTHESTSLSSCSWAAVGVPENCDENCSISRSNSRIMDRWPSP